MFGAQKAALGFRVKLELSGLCFQVSGAWGFRV